MNTFTNFIKIFMSSLLLVLFTSVSFAQNCTLSVDFEAKSWEGQAYAQRTVTDEWGEWTVSGVVRTGDENDRQHSGEKSIRLRGNTGDNCHFQMNFDKPNGIGTVSFYYASYSNHTGGTIVLYYSTNGGSSWTNGGSIAPLGWSGSMLEATFVVNIPGNARIKIVREGGLKTGTTVNIDDLCITNYNPGGFVDAPTFDPPGGSHSGPVNVAITSTSGATIRYTTDGNDPTESSPVYTAKIPISTATTLKAKAWKEGLQPSPISTANYIFPQKVTTLAALRDLAPEYTGGVNKGTTVFKYTGQAIVTQKQTFHNVKYIQDGTGAMMLFDDVGGNIQDDVEIGDKITNITGTLTNYYGMVEMVPQGQCDVVAIMQQTPAVVVTAAQLDKNPNSPLQAKLITLKDVMYVKSGAFETGKYYDLKDKNGIVFDSLAYTDNWEADYIGTQLPTVLININGVCLFKGPNAVSSQNRIVPLDNSNNVVGIHDLNKSTIKLSPNPADNFVKIVTSSTMRLEVYSLLGNLITTESLSEGSNIISVSQYPAGMYLMKLIDSSTGQSYIQKLVVK